MNEFTEETYKKLVQKVGALRHEACCGDHSSGIDAGVFATLEVLGVKVDCQQFYEDVVFVENKLYSEEQRVRRL